MQGSAHGAGVDVLAQAQLAGVFGLLQAAIPSIGPDAAHTFALARTLGLVAVTLQHGLAVRFAGGIGRLLALQ